MQNYLVKNLVTNEITEEFIDEIFINEILEQGNILELNQNQKFKKPTKKEREDYEKTQIDILKQEKIKQIKQLTSDFIINKYPIGKQISNLFEKNESEFTKERYDKMTIWIKKVRNKSNEIEGKVKGLSGVDEVNGIGVEKYFEEVL